MHARLIRCLIAALTGAALFHVSIAAARTPAAPVQTSPPVSSVSGSVAGKKAPTSSNHTRSLYYVISNLAGQAAFETVDASGALQTTTRNVHLKNGFAYIKITGASGPLSMVPAPPTPAVTSTPAATVAPKALAAPTPSGDLSSFMSQIYLPFILGNRTVGGAEGTEVVVYVHPINADNAEVFYFYLHTEHPSRTVDLSAFVLDASAAPAREKLLDKPFTLNVGEYARLPMKKMKLGGESKWFVTSASAITRHAIDGGLAPNLMKMLHAAHRAACEKAIGGTGPSEVTLGTSSTLTLKCGNAS